MEILDLFAPIARIVALMAKVADLFGRINYHEKNNSLSL